MNQGRRLDFFSRWIGASVLRRAHYLNGALLSLAIGVAFLPVAFVHVGGGAEKELTMDAKEIDWPTPSAEIREIELAKILYKAQVAKAAEESEPEIPVRGEEEAVSWILAILFLAVVGWVASRPMKI